MGFPPILLLELSHGFDAIGMWGVLYAYKTFLFKYYLQ
jgi:hypothetical protein